MATCSSSSFENPSNEYDLPPRFKQFLHNANNYVSIKLDNTNFALWKTQVIAALKACKVLHHLTASETIPPSTIIVNGSLVDNPQYLLWQDVDENLLSCLFATMSPTVLSQVMHHTTTAAMWKTLEERYSASSTTHIYQLKMKLFNSTKGGQSMQAYLDSVKALADSLAVAQDPVSAADLQVIILRGLPPEYDSFISSVRLRKKPMSLQTLTSHLLSEELHKQMKKSLTISESSQDVHTALVANTRGRGRGRGRYPAPRGRGSAGQRISWTWCSWT